MLSIIGLALIIYGYVSYRNSDRWASRTQKGSAQRQFPAWFPLLIKVGGILFVVIGVLLIVSDLLL